METESTLMENMTEEQQMQVFNLMNMAGIEDVNFAAQMLAQFNFDLDKAAESMLNIQSGLDKTPSTNSTGMAVEGRKINRSDSPQAGDDLRELYKKHLQKKMAEEEDPLKKGVTNVLSGVKSVFNSIIPASMRGQNGGEEFVLFFRDNYEDLNKLMKFNKGSFEENIQKASEYKKPLLVYIHVNDLENQAVPPIVFSETMISLMNSKFHLLGLLSKSEGVQPLKKYLKIDGKCLLAVFRTNLLDDVQLMETIPLTTETESGTVMEKLKDVDGSFYFLMAEEDKIKTEVRTSLEREKRQQMEREANYYGGLEEEVDYHGYQDNFGSHQQSHFPTQPHGFSAEQQRLEEDRILRQIQEEEYKEVERQIREKQLRDVQEESLKRQREEEEKQIRELQAEEQKKIDLERTAQRQIKLQRLPAEPAEGSSSAITIAFRLPDGNRIERRFNNTDKVEALYDYVDTQDIQFDKATLRYDFIQPRPFLCIDDKQKAIGEYFEGSDQELIQIREHNA